MLAAPQLSVIVPVLNEEAAIGPFWAMLEGQRGLEFEVLFVDGGSRDGTREQLRALAAAHPEQVRLWGGERGRARQLNLGAAQSRAPWLLFLHVDCRLSRSNQLALALTQMARATVAAGHERLAGHFPLRFTEPRTPSPLGYAYYQAKARLDRPGCTHGDQGFLLARVFFAQVGPFEEDWPVLEDTRLAERVRARGGWLLLPGELLTSPRRFEVEGLWQRQVLNALIMNFAALQWRPFFDRLPGLYRSQSRTEPLRLTPFFHELQLLLAQLPRRQRWALWYHTGGYVRSQGWQPAYALDVRRQVRAGLPAHSGPTPWLERWERWGDPLTDHAGGRWLTAVLVWCWYQLTRRWCRHAESRRAAGATPPSDQESP